MRVKYYDQDSKLLGHLKKSEAVALIKKGVAVIIGRMTLQRSVKISF